MKGGRGEERKGEGVRVRGEGWRVGRCEIKERGGGTIPQYHTEWCSYCNYVAINKVY